MYLFLDNSADDVLIFGLSRGQAWDFTKIAQPQELLAALEDFLIKKKIKLTDLQGLAVRIGTGRFTGTRVAVTLANSLAYALKIKVAGVRTADLRPAVGLFKKIKTGHYVSAAYSAKPHLYGQR